jgi:hypothetical protein
VPPAFTVPVAVDSTPPAAQSDSLVRMIYFRITAEDPNTPMLFASGSIAFPFILLGLEGIVLGPATGEVMFQSSEDIDGLVNLIEASRSDEPDSPHAFGTSSIWLPFTAIEQSKATYNSRSEESNARVERGDIFRLDGDAFHKAWWFLESRINETTLREYFQIAPEFSAPQEPRISFSPIETLAFRQWSENILGGQSPHGLAIP